jgi:hypothetical protein
MASPPSDEPTTVEDWSTWLTARVRTRERTFRNETSVMVAEYNRENEYQTAYHGREILELLQNADDAGASVPESRAIFVLRPEGLYVANAGTAFSPPGIDH